MNTVKFLIAVALATASFGATAGAMYHCAGPHGETYFSDHGCSNPDKKPPPVKGGAMTVLSVTAAAPSSSSSSPGFAQRFDNGPSQNQIGIVRRAENGVANAGKN